MVTARRMTRWTLYGLVGLFALIILVRVGVGIHLATPAGKAMVARKVSDQIGMPVEVTTVRVGLLTSNIGMRVFDPTAPEPSKAEVLAVENADADVSLFGLAFGRVAPKRVNLKGVNLTLHVSEDGKVITTLPKTPEGGGGEVPVIKLTGGLTIRQDGRPEFALQNLDLSVEPAGDTVTLSGTIDDPQWAKWTVSGDINRVAKTGWVELGTTDAPLTMDRLESIPFVPPAVWKHVRADGRGAAAVRLWTESDGDVRYSVDIKPNAASLTLPDADVTLAKVTGLIRVSGAKVTLTGTRAELAGGTLAVDGELDFGPEPTVMTLKVAAEKLDIRQLPAEWGLPKDFEGKLKGNAQLVLRIHSDGRIEPEGGGEGAITEVKVLGFDADDIPIRLRKAGTRYEFQQPKKDARHTRPASVPIRAALRQDKKPADPPKKDDKKDPKKDEGPTTLDATIRFRDIDLAELLDTLNVKLGYNISGKISVEASVMVPVAQAGSQAAYQFTGKLTSPALRLEGLTIHDLSANMTYQDGKFTLTNLSGKIDQPGKTDATPGTFRGTASVMTSPPGDATASLTFEGIPLGEVLKALPDFNLAIRGTVSGKANLKVP